MLSVTTPLDQHETASASLKDVQTCSKDTKQCLFGINYTSVGQIVLRSQNHSLQIDTVRRAGLDKAKRDDKKGCGEEDVLWQQACVHRQELPIEAAEHTLDKLLANMTKERKSSASAFGLLEGFQGRSVTYFWPQCNCMQAA